MLRRLAAVGFGLLFVILVAVGIRGCLNAKKERTFENYVADLTALTTESNNLSESFFGRLEDPGDLSALQFEAEVKADRGTAEGLFDRARGLEAPDELQEANDLVTLTFQLRRDALAVISDEIATAFAREGSEEAIAVIASQMKVLLASDVLYGRAQTLIDQGLKEEQIDTEVPASVFVPAPPNWLDPDVIADALGQVQDSASASATPGVHGLALVGTTLLPNGIALESGTEATAPADGAELQVEVQNQGESEESDLTVSYETDAGGAGEGTIGSIAPQETASASIPIEPPPTAGESVTLTVSVEEVPGEEIGDNNVATYQVSFE